LYGGEEVDAALVQLEGVRREEEEVGMDMREYEGSWVMKAEKFFSREERRKEGEEVSFDSFKKVMFSLQ